MQSIAADQLEFAEMSEPCIVRSICVPTVQAETWLKMLDEVPGYTASPAYRLPVKKGGNVIADWTVITIAIDPNQSGHVISAGIRIKGVVEGLGREVPFC